MPTTRKSKKTSLGMIAVANKVRDERAQWVMMDMLYREHKSRSGFTQKDVYGQLNYIRGLREALRLMMAAEWKAFNTHGVPEPTERDVDNYVRQYAWK